MPWVPLTIDDVATKITGPELDAARSSAKAKNQPDPLPDIIQSVIDTVRGYVLTCANNTVGPSGTIPSQLVETALILVRTGALNRLPVSSLHTDARMKEYDNAIARLKDVAACRFTIEAPTEKGPEQTSAPGPSFTARSKQYTRRDEDGI
ncbi:MAG: hypothetical protein LBV12_07075 [Puniceicoccales bacterium]|jgi:hypothetical protein|nr:hypothetical protein [Puniceicoccales bacterium]